MIGELGPRARRVYAALSDRILRGDLAPGAKLLSHLELAAEFGVAPMTVRHVLGRLAAEGLVSREPGRGTFVRAQAALAVLVVDDDPAVRAILGGHVAAAGYPAITASGPTEGFAALEGIAPIALVLCALRLPGVQDGTAFVRTIRLRRPELPLATMLTNSRDLDGLHGTAECPVLILSKPLRPSQVDEVLRLVLPRPLLR